MRKLLVTAFITALGIGAAPGAVADVVEMPPEQATPSIGSGIAVPQRGMAMERVAQSYGTPGEKIGPVGDPPISRWVYNDFTVYFEHHLVLHSVIHTSH
jgi:hypothetical protein